MKTSMKDTYDYDVNSMYPYLMTSERFRFPLCDYEEVDIQTKRQKGWLEIYKLKINGDHKWFKKSPNNYYCTYHLDLLNYLNIPYEKVGDTKYVYKECVKGSVVFESLRSLYDMKKEGNKYVKPVINSIWGSLSMEKSYEIKIEEVKSWQMKDVWCFDVQTGRAKMKGGTRVFRHCTARLKMFLLAYYRLYFVKDILMPLEDEGYTIYQVATDGFITDAPQEAMKKIYDIGKNIGELKLVKVFEGTHQIINQKKVVKV